MTQGAATTLHESLTYRIDTAARYHIRVHGWLDDTWSDWFAGMHVIQEHNGDTLLDGTLRDQMALHAVLRRVRDLGLPLLLVQRLPDE